VVQGQPRQIIHETPLSKITKAKMYWRQGSIGRVPVLQVQGPEFKLHFHQKRKNRGREMAKWWYRACSASSRLKFKL
jgi:hypothetical protein